MLPFQDLPGHSLCSFPMFRLHFSVQYVFSWYISSSGGKTSPVACQKTNQSRGVLGDLTYQKIHPYARSHTPEFDGGSSKLEIIFFIFYIWRHCSTAFQLARLSVSCRMRSVPGAFCLIFLVPRIYAIFLTSAFWHFAMKYQCVSIFLNVLLVLGKLKTHDLSD